MGRYLNVEFGKMADDIRDDFYVDKSGYSLSLVGNRIT